MNSIYLIGRLTKDPELKQTSNGTSVIACSLAVDRIPGKDGKKEADFIPIVVWGKQAEVVSNYSSKGKLLAVRGRLQIRTSEYEGTKRNITEVIAEEVQILEWKDKGQNNNVDKELVEISDSDIPF